MQRYLDVLAHELADEAIEALGDALVYAYSPSDGDARELARRLRAHLEPLFPRSGEITTKIVPINEDCTSC